MRVACIRGGRAATVPPLGLCLPSPVSRLPVFLALALLALAEPAHAEPAFARLYKAEFGYTPSCNACHKDGGGTPVNGFGEQFKDAGMNLAAWKAIAALDADGDGVANETEARARANPGSKSSTPGDKGDWLDTASLIPKEVQTAFPDVREYLPRDAILTEADIARAKSLGASLTAGDENTIYIPLKDKRPVGTAIIFPAEHQGKAFFLLLVTDRQLKVIAVQPLDTRHLPAADKSPVYGSFKGLALDQLPAGEGGTLEAAITQAVKKAGTLVYVRLKNA